MSHFGIIAFLALFSFGAVGNNQDTQVDPSSLLSMGTQKNGLVDKIYQECKDNTQFQECVKDYLSKNKDKVKKAKKGLRRGGEGVPLPSQRSVFQKFLSQYLNKRFEQKVRKGKDGKKRTVDHTTYFQLYEAQLTKIVFTTINSYCLYTHDFDPKKGYFPPVEKAEREHAFEEKKKILNDDIDGRTFFTKCARTLENACQDDVNDACITLNNLRKLNRAVIRNKRIIESTQCKQGDEGNCQKGFAGHGVEFYQPGKRGHGKFDELTSITAGEFHKNVYQRIEKLCPDSSPLTQECLNAIAVKDSPAPKQEEKDDEIIGKFEIQSLIVGDNIDNYDVDELKQEILDEGGSEELIEQIIGDIEDESDQKIKEIKAKMKEKYDKERAAQLEKIKATFKTNREKEKTSLVHGLKTQTKEVTQLLLFNNVITSYLPLDAISDDGPNDSKMNLSSFRQEIDHANKQNSMAGFDQEFIEGLQESLKDVEKRQQASQRQRRGNSSESSRSSGSSERVTINPQNVYNKIIKEQVLENQPQQDSD